MEVAAGGTVSVKTWADNCKQSTTAPPIPNTATSPPRQVTTINIHHHPQGGGTCSVVVGSEQKQPLIDEDTSAADQEVSNFTNDAVNLRNKKKRQDEVSERPMSWEGELSDSEMPTVKPEPEETSMESIIEATTAVGTNSTVITHSDDDKHHTINFNSDSTNEKTAERVRSCTLTSQTELPLLVDKLLSNGVYGSSCSISSGLPNKSCPANVGPGPTPSPDSAVYSCYSPQASPVTSHRHFLSSSSGISSPFTPSLSRNNSDASQYGGSQHSSSCYSHSYSSVSVSPTQFSPTHSPIQGRHHIHRATTGFPSPVLNARQANHLQEFNNADESIGGNLEEKMSSLSSADALAHSGLASPGISRQQLINSPCPICGDKISGFHYGIFSCESCKGFFKRTVQNRKNYVCLRGSSCPVTTATRKKCPACRFDKCLTMGMKLEAIREDRTRGGRSTYQCSYTVPAGLVESKCIESYSTLPPQSNLIPKLLQEIMEVEHLWQYSNDNETIKSGTVSGTGSNGNGSGSSGSSASSGGGNGTISPSLTTLSHPNNGHSDPSANICNIADHRLYKIVKWCKSLPLFKNISIDDQISLLINAWCELLLFSCCFRSVSSPGEIRVSLGKSISLAQARALGLGPPIERMLNFTEHLRRLRVDNYEYVAMKVIVLLCSDTSDLREPEKVRASQEKALQALQQYTLAHYPDIPSKFGELLLRIPELQRTCQIGKEMLSIKSKEGEGPSFNLLMELLRGDH